MPDSTEDFKVTPEQACIFISNALKDAHELAWPDSPQGGAAALIIHDLYEFASVTTATAQGGRWSVERGLERSLYERIEVLIGISMDVNFARRYWNTVVEDPAPARPLKPRKKARAEDGLDILVRKGPFSKETANAIRQAHNDNKTISADWYVHPTALGPRSSLRLPGTWGSDAGLIAAQWEHLTMILGEACFWAVYTADRLDVSMNVGLVKGLDAASKALPHQEGELFRETFKLLGDRQGFREG